MRHPQITRRTLVALLAGLLTVASAWAQDDAPQPALRFGYLSYSKALMAMPGYALVTQQMADMKAQYEAETRRVEDEFNRKYEEFLEGQHSFPKTILQKRQNELQQLMERNIQFKSDSQKELAEAEREALAPLRIQLIELLGSIGRKCSYAFILDTDVKALPFINPDWGEDINHVVIDELGARQ